MPTNLLNNPSFETTTTPWEARENCTLSRTQTASAFDGAYAGRMTCTTAGAMDIQNDTDRPAVTAGTLFVWSARVRPVGTTSRQASVFVEWIGTPGALGGSFVTCPAGQWTTVSVSGTAPAGTTAIRPVLRMSAVALGEEWLVDGLAVYTGTSDPTWTPSNLTPTADAGVDKTATVGQVVTLTGSGTDPDGTIASYAWTLPTRPAGSAAALSGTGATRTFTADVAGMYVAELRVTDNAGAQSAPDSATITVTAGSTTQPTILVRESGTWVKRLFAALSLSATPLLKTSAAKLVRSDNNAEAILTGVNFMYHEHKGSTATVSSLIGKMRTDWGGNCLMVGYATRGVNLNLAHPYTGTAYLTLLDQIVAAAKANGCYVVFAPRWGGIEGRTTDGGAATNTQFVGVPPTTGNDSATASLTTLATRYAAEPGVMFATQVEPNGTISEAGYRDYAQSCVTAVRNTGSQAIVMAAGLDFGRDLSLYVGNALTGGNVAYKTHVYNTQATWQANFKNAVDAGLPVVIGETGAPIDFGGTAVMTEADVNALIAYREPRKLPMFFWGFEAETTPRLTTDDTTAKPLGTLGASVRAQMWKTPPVVGDAYRTSSPPAYPADTQLTRNATVTATSGTATTLADGNWADGEWRSSGYPATVTYTGLASAGQVAYAHSSGNYIADSDVTGGDTYNEMGAYVVETSPDGTTWTARATVTGNTRRSRTHRFDMGGHSRLRLRTTAGNPKNAAGNVDAALRYLEVSSNLLDTWLVHGDSITTAGAQAHRNLGGRVTGLNGTRQPLFEVLGWPGLGIAHIADAGTQRTAWLGYLTATACRQAILAMGANDYQMAAATFETKLRVACNDLLSRGITPYLATVPWSPDSTRNTGVQALNARITSVVSTSAGKVKAGPDFYAHFQANPSLISGDQLHPTDPAGYESWAQVCAATVAAATPGDMPTGSSV